MKNNILTYSIRGIGILTILFIVFLVSYRTFIFPTEIRKECSLEALDYVAKKEQATSHYVRQERDSDYEFLYRYCLNKNGLKSDE